MVEAFEREVMHLFFRSQALEGSTHNSDVGLKNGRGFEYGLMLKLENVE